jgi:hypothetical protein
MQALIIIGGYAGIALTSFFSLQNKEAAAPACAGVTASANTVSLTLLTFRSPSIYFSPYWN